MSNLTFNCVACTEKMSKAGKPYYLVGIVLSDGTLCSLFGFKKHAVGEDINCSVVSRVIGNSVIPTLKIIED